MDHRFIPAPRAAGIRVYTGWSNQVPSWDDGPQLSASDRCGLDLAGSVDSRKLRSRNHLVWGRAGWGHSRTGAWLAGLTVVGRRLADGDDGYVAAVDGRGSLAGLDRGGNPRPRGR